MFRLVCILILFFPLTSTAEQVLNIGIFSYRPKNILEMRWQPLTAYLEQHLNNTKINIHILNANELEESISHNKLDFVFTNPTHYIALRQKFPFSGALATLVSKQNNTKTSVLGGVIFTLPERTGINKLIDVKNKVIASSGVNFTGGYQAPAYELTQHGIDLQSDVDIRFTGAPHDKVIQAVLEGKVDVGFIRTGIIEQMEQEGKLDPRQLKIINQQDLPGYPYRVSSRLYPQWPFVVMPNVDSGTANLVASALLLLSNEHSVSKSIGIYGFSTPADYSPVEEVMRELRLPPFDEIPKFTLQDIWDKHQFGVILLFTALSIIISLIFVLIGRNRQLILAGIAVKESEQRQSDLLNNTSAVIYIMDLEGRYLFVNKTIEKLLNITNAEIKGKTDYDLFPFEMAKILRANDKRVIEVDGAIELEETVLLEDGEHIYWSTKFPLKNISGETYASCGISTDITKRKQAEEKLTASERLKRQILHTVPDLVWLKDVSGRYLMCNTEFERLFGVKESELIGKTDYDFFDRELASFFRKNDMMVVHADTPLSNEESLSYAEDGHLGLFETIKSPFKNAENKTVGILGIARDITDRKYAEEQLLLSASVFNNTREGILILDTDNQIIDANPASYQLTGYSKAELMGKKPSFMNAAKQKNETNTEMWQIIADTGYWQGDIWNQKKNGEVYAQRLSIATIKDKSEKITHYVSVFSDITYIKEHEAELQKIAHNDALTGLPNRLLLRDRMFQAFAQTSRHDKSIAVCYLDLDGFKEVNDQYGHKAGDLVLIEIAKRLQFVIRTGDTVSRLGGDEFVLLMLDIESTEQLKKIIQRIIDDIAIPIDLPEASVSVSVSVGITLYPDDKNEADILLRHADKAMYEAKQAGKNCYAFFDPKLEKELTETQLFYREIELAITNNQFRLHYQPKINMRTGEIIGVEALLRWQHPTKGLLAPFAFLPTIENHPLIVKLGNWVIKEALTQLQLWQEKGLLIGVSVNLAARQLQQHDFITNLKELLNDFNSEFATRLEFEILETAALDNLDTVNKILKECEQLNIKVSLDDFGTGYSSLTYLKHLSVQVIKIDQSFIRDILIDPSDMTIVEGILQLSKAFHRTPIAEGVETEKHGSLLLMLGCELGQGYAIARPMPANEVPNWVNTYKIPEEWKQIQNTSQDNSGLTLSSLALEHYRLVAFILNAIENRSPSFLPKNCDNASLCNLGHWLSHTGYTLYGESEEYQKIVEEHRKVHEISNRVIKGLNDNKTDLSSIKLELVGHRNNVLAYLKSLQVTMPHH